jgi:hypothetical protein
VKKPRRTRRRKRREAEPAGWQLAGVLLSLLPPLAPEPPAAPLARPRPRAEEPPAFHPAYFTLPARRPQGTGLP